MERLFYDGSCGLCHWLVRFVAVRDREGRFRFAPLGGVTFRETFREEERAILPQSLVVRTVEGTVHTRSDAVAYVLSRLERPWPVAGRVLAALPRPLRDAGYECVARMRRRFFSAPNSVCPRVPDHLRDRFET